MDITQTILLAIIIVLAVFLVALGFQVFFVLRDLRKTLTRMNILFEDANNLIAEVKKPVESAGNFVSALTAGAGIVHLLKKDKRSKEKSGSPTH
ncbi:hypothetical protein A2870_01015 [Candidatus Curtissbacteria bacterium RIFCSPHIGHO2_01_FULL_41_11]|uniref:DUF948 domain-containing protein n=1 Tax=Candidatus Curtissbacteria bacterium RIFCSPHIGHO2_01_FULL_41_11 TaxID=1797711 RepID=A0A1F5G3P6_9BACT|nr:MAG: hypothetical protein A2870_01015 [Candidatus Curtissbacteria bacterium RIFCSPHIGHO2_01_FULL_41_11]